MTAGVNRSMLQELINVPAGTINILLKLFSGFIVPQLWVFQTKRKLRNPESHENVNKNSQPTLGHVEDARRSLKTDPVLQLLQRYTRQTPQTFQHPLLKEYTSNHSWNPANI